MTTPFDDAIAATTLARYHNHRLEDHSDVVSRGILADLRRKCAVLREDFDSNAIKEWYNVSAPGDRRRKVDLFVGEPGHDGNPDIGRVRIAIENKSVITAHRNRTNRFDDLHKVLAAVHAARPEALLIATVLVGLADKVLNIPDQVHKLYKDREKQFQKKVPLPKAPSLVKTSPLKVSRLSEKTP